MTMDFSSGRTCQNLPVWRDPRQLKFNGVDLKEWESAEPGCVILRLAPS